MHIVLAVYYYYYTKVFCMLFFFFFQAEDGIRDLTVTGVQTCALPISFRKDRNSVSTNMKVCPASSLCCRSSMVRSPVRATLSSVTRPFTRLRARKL